MTEPKAAQDLAEAKARLRKTALAARKAAHLSGSGAAEAARDHLLASRLLTGAGVIAGYRPIRSELDPTPLMETLHVAGHRVAVPVIQGAGLALKFAAWAPGCAMTEGAFGAEVPADPVWLTPDLVIAPLVAFDRRGRRLGYGGGFYDRSLEVLRADAPVRAIGFAYAAQEVPNLPAEPTDQTLDAIVTEAGLLRP
ncbi:MAG: 5-formyltetrahydrofolate cyclo-ligase [Pseudomonadota bacterium]